MCNIEEFKEGLEIILQQIISFYQRGGKTEELFYRDLILDIASSLENWFIIESEKENGQGRADLIMIPKTTTKLTQAIIPDIS